ncbi:MAG: hypothetical protein FWE02_07005 [Defluviitaleaceae bacterium]|nr:hypothetical protein [Defluviitaleaceae bacterium]
MPSKTERFINNIKDSRWSILWIIYTIGIPVISAFWFSSWQIDVHNFLEVHNFLDVNPTFTTITLVILSLFVGCIIKYKDQCKLSEKLKETQKNLKQSEYEFKISRKVRQDNDNNRDQKFLDVFKHIKSNFRTNTFAPIISKPEEQLKLMQKGFETTILDLFDKTNNVGLITNLFYRIPSIDNHWREIDGYSTSEHTGDELAEEETSTFYHTVKGQGNYGFLSFYHSKKEAYKLKKYYPSTDEKDDDMPGSIICKYFAIMERKMKKPYIEAVFSLSTMREPLISGKEKGELQIKTDMLRSTIVDNYERKLRLELSLFFMEKKRSQQKCLVCNVSDITDNKRLMEYDGLHMHRKCAKKMLKNLHRKKQSMKGQNIIPISDGST